MAGLSDTMEASVLNLVRGVDITAATTYYIALHTVDPTDDGSGAEVTGGAYGRVAVSALTGSWSAPSASAGDQVITNSSDIVFPTASADWGTVTHSSIWDAATNGTMVWSGALDTARSVTTGTTFSIDAGNLTLRAG